MKTHLLTTLLLLGLVPSLQAAPQIACDQREFDAGSRRIASKVEHTFVIKNTGDQPLKINEVKPGCGCTTANLEKSELLPGESTNIKASLDLTMRRGQQNKNITIKSNDPANPDLILTVKVFSQDDFKLEPEYIDLGQIAAGVSITRKVTLTVTSEKVWKITALQPAKNLVQAASEASADGKTHTITITVLPQTAAGAFYDNVQIRTDNPDSPVLPLQIVGTITEGLSVAPNPLMIEVTPGPATRTITVRTGSIKVFKILGAAYPDPSVGVEVGAPTVFGQQVKLRFPSVTAAQDGRELIITTDAKGLETIRVPVKVTSPGSPAKS